MFQIYNSSDLVPLDSAHDGSRALHNVSLLMGWIYFFAWSISYYPQIYENWNRKSVIGYCFDLLALESIDMTLYSVYNIGLFAFPFIQEEYKKKNHTDVIPVEINDVIFGFHSVACCAILIFQCIRYEKGGQRVSIPCRFLMGAILLFVISTMVAASADALEWVDLLSYLSYVKIVTTIKYVPQAYMNHKRRSTQGFSIGLVLMDLAGGVFSICQMIVISCDTHDWSSFTGNPTKFALGLLTIVFDLVLVFQHYVAYRNSTPPEILRASSDEEQLHG